MCCVQTDGGAAGSEEVTVDIMAVDDQDKENNDWDAKSKAMPDDDGTISVSRSIVQCEVHFFYTVAHKILGF